MTPDGQPAFGPLAGIRIVDLTVALAGAFATMLLADLGAEIIKVESLQHYPTATRGPRFPPRGDDLVAQSWAWNYPNMDPGKDPWNRISWFNSQGRNKRAMTMDVSRPEGRDLFLRLIERSDGLIENNPVGVLERLNIAPEQLIKRNPELIVVRMPPLGLSGPDSAVRGFGFHFEEFAGMLEVQGYPGGETVSSLFMDAASGPAAANAFLIALIERRETRKAAHYEVSQVENVIYHFGDLTMDAVMNKRAPKRWGNRSPAFAPQGCYPCAGDDQWVVLSVRCDDEWAALRKVLGELAELSQPDLESFAGRQAAHDQIDAVIARWTSARPAMEAASELQRAGIPAGPVMSEADANSDPHLHERGFFQLLEHPVAGTHFYPGTNFKLTETPLQLWRAAPTVGQDNEYVYKEILGISQAEYDRLTEQGHIGNSY